MSNGGGELSPRSRPLEWDRLELAVRRLMDDYISQRNRAVAAEQRVVDLEAALQTISGGGPDPIELRERLALLEDENLSLRERLARARMEVERIMTRLQFLEGQR